MPRRRAPSSRVLFEKVVAPMKKAIIETRDLSQPQGLLVGWLEAPRPRKTVFPLFSFPVLARLRACVFQEEGGY